jgi:hypothetical protein
MYMNFFSNGIVEPLSSITDSNWVGSAIDIKSTSGCCFNLGSTMINWFNRKKTFVALSLAKEKYMGLSMASYESIWI